MTTIQPFSERPIFTLINTFHVEQGNQQAVIDSLSEITERIMQHLPGFVSANVHKSEDGEHVVNYVQWKSREHFQAMFQNPEAKAHMEEVGRLAESVTPIFYTVAYAHSA